MTATRIAPDTLDAALAAALARDGRAVVAALGDDGFRVALPESFELGDHQALAVPEGRETMLDVVVPEDRIAVVAAWERARENGIGVCPVRALADPDRTLTLSMVDARPNYGTWLALLTNDHDPAEPAPELIAGPLVVPARPRLATAHKSMTAVITEIDANVTKMLGWTAEEMLGERSTAFIHPDDHARAVASWMQLLANGGTQRVRLRHRRNDGTWIWTEVEHVHNGAEDPDEVDVVAHISDISDEMAAHEELQRREQLFRRLAESLPTGVLQLHHDRSVVYANARLATILGVAGVGSADDFLVTVGEADRRAVDEAIAATIGCGEDAALEVEVAPPSGGGSRRCALTLAAVAGPDGEAGALICVSDVTESARLREELEFRATVDALTGCLNRASAMQSLDRLLAEPDAPGAAVIFIDVDNFKGVNDRLGHAAGDELIVEVARRLGELSRTGDIVGRLGGDEFLLVCRGVEGPVEAMAIARRVHERLHAPAALAAGVVDLAASVGVACATAGASADTVVAHADAAMYEAKRRRDGRPVLAA